MNVTAPIILKAKSGVSSDKRKNFMFFQSRLERSVSGLGSKEIPECMYYTALITLPLQPFTIRLSSVFLGWNRKLKRERIDKTKKTEKNNMVGIIFGVKEKRMG